MVPNFTNKSKVQLLFRATRDGWNATDFSRLCHNKGPTFVLVRSSAGKICGGYTTVSWQPGNGEGLRDDSAVLFSVDSRQKFPCLNKDQAVQHHSSFGPMFSNKSLAFGSPMNAQAYSGFSAGNDQYGLYNLTADNCGKSTLTGETPQFKCIELEVF